MLFANTCRHHWGGSQGPLDGFQGGYSNPVLVDWDGDGRLDLIVGDMIGLFDWYPNRGSTTEPVFEAPIRLHVLQAVDGSSSEALFGPWRVQPAVGCLQRQPSVGTDVEDDDGGATTILTGSTARLPGVITMDLDLDLAYYPRADPSSSSSRRKSGGGERVDAAAMLLPPRKCCYPDGSTIQTHGVYTPSGGDGRGRTKLQLVDWDHTGTLDLIVGVGPQHNSAFHSSFVLLLRNRGWTTTAEPVFDWPELLLFNDEGEGLEFFRHGAHPVAVDWAGPGQGWGLVVGSDMGNLQFWKPGQFGTAARDGGAHRRAFRTEAQRSRL